METDTVATVEERIVDTITLVLDSIPATDSVLLADTAQFIPPFEADTLGFSEADTLNPANDSIAGMQGDTLEVALKKKIRPRSQSAIETQVICSASDSSYRDMTQKKIYYFGNAEAKY